jgi:chromosome partitioning protein
LRSVVLANQKGGVGKTTTAVHLAHGLAMTGLKVALFDLDPQANATVALQGMEGADRAEEGSFLRRILPDLWLLPSPGESAPLGRFASVDVARLRQLVASLPQDGFHWLVVDCPPRMDQWGWAGLQICDEVIVPVQTEFFAMHGLSQMLTTLESASNEIAGSARLLGILPTMVDVREPVACEVLEDLRRNLGSRVFQTMILRDVHLVEASSHGRTVFGHSPRSKGALCYGELVREVIHGGSSLG